MYHPVRCDHSQFTRSQRGRRARSENKYQFNGCDRAVGCSMKLAGGSEIFGTNGNVTLSILWPVAIFINRPICCGKKLVLDSQVSGAHGGVVCSIIRPVVMFI